MRELLVAATLTGFLALPGAAQSDVPAPAMADIAVAQIQDLGTPFALKANLYLPAGPHDSAMPLLLYIHGKGGAYNQAHDAVLGRLLPVLLSRGIAVARIDYRRSGRMPQMLFDTKAYIRFFRAHAAEFHLDPHRLGIWGVSRGGNLAAMLAVTGDVKALEGEVGGNAGQSSLLEASVIESPLTDMFLSSDDKAAAMFGDYLGSDAPTSRAIVQAYRSHDTSSPYWKQVEQIERVNPLNYVTKASPPALILCGGLDPANVILNCSAFFDRYIQQGAVASYYALSTGTHVRVGSDIEQAGIAWLAERLSQHPPAVFPDEAPAR
jgi:acetyl esterase/lipase